jgi:hypothetical protein
MPAAAAEAKARRAAVYKARLQKVTRQLVAPVRTAVKAAAAEGGVSSGAVC